MESQLTRSQLYTYLAQTAAKTTRATLRASAAAALQRFTAPWSPVRFTPFGTRPPPAASVAASGVLKSLDFAPISESGFGNRWICYPWSMQWWRGKLYVGTDMAFPCVEYFRIHSALPRLQRYPPRLDPDVTCAHSLLDMRLQAEIWRYSPDTGAWDRVYQSPRDVEFPEQPGRYLPRDIGFRNMLVIQEPDGTEALYVAGVGPRSAAPGSPPPRLLRTLDGVTFDPVPGVPESLPGGRSVESLRALAVYKGRIYVTVGAVLGDGTLFEVGLPPGDTTSFRQASPVDLRISEIAVFNEYLYVGVRHPLKGYAVMKTDAAGTPPYTFWPIVPHGGGRTRLPSHFVPSMYVFQGRLYVGTSDPGELIRIHPDDRWDLIMGNPRRAPDGLKRPLSGLGDGFGLELNQIVQRMQVHEGWLYVGTANMSAKLRNLPVIGELLRPHMGFGLYATVDGEQFVTVTHTGFDDPTNLCARTLASTPVGLFLGALNAYSGAKVYLGASKQLAT